MDTIYERIGGAPAVSAVVDLFYERVLGDPELSPYFTGADLGALKAHQRDFVGQALGATASYEGRAMREAHAPLAVRGEDFDRVVGHLAAALAEAGVDEATISTIGGALAPLKSDIVTG
ncbi:group I truncated hemoglobin [Streptomyces beijiangensis]|uniref:Group 1 truncated hemoglobin n=1 Tax=Streptomyces beijiangensis TaxID=163361 RepID=A0A939JHM4_9ACTN|nr:group 1 truncated hemoglobin [Streptomyces beijiangensis]MBO0512777.1 group 1 truncated hemoglobin [Streptomyces beijiangensis]